MTHITDLPEGILKDVATFLPQSSAALFAAAITAPSSSWRESSWQRQPSDLSKAIVSSFLSTNQDQQHGGPYSVLDFVDIEKDLARQLTDDDLGAVLVCMDAVNKVKRLKLTGLLNIVGHGLEPLRGSTKLEQIDLSLVKQHESPKLEPEPLITVEGVIPVLNSIVEANGNSLKQIQFPHKWEGIHNALDQTSAVVEFDQFRARYNQLLDRSRPFSCADNLEHACPREVNGVAWLEPHWDLCQNFTCYSCLNTYCGHTVFLGICEKCKKRVCSDCISLSVCYVCNDVTCKYCGECNCRECGAECDWCNGFICSRNICVDELLHCRGCHKKNCFECTEVDNIRKCNECNMELCFDCRRMEYQATIESGNDFCDGCLSLLNENGSDDSS